MGSLHLFRGLEFRTFWRDHLQAERSLLFIVGHGFDPRVLGRLREIVGARADVPRHCVALDMAECYATDEAASALRRANAEGLAAFFPGDALQVRRLTPADADGIRNISLNAAVRLADVIGGADQFSDVVLDISALPRLVYLTLLNQLLSRFVAPTASAPLASRLNLHVVYAEAAPIDTAIVKKEVDVDLAPIQNLSIRLDEEASLSWPVIWFPVLAPPKKTGGFLGMARVIKLMTLAARPERAAAA